MVVVVVAIVVVGGVVVVVVVVVVLVVAVAVALAVASASRPEKTEASASRDARAASVSKAETTAGEPGQASTRTPSESPKIRFGTAHLQLIREIAKADAANFKSLKQVVEGSSVSARTKSQTLDRLEALAFQRGVASLKRARSASWMSSAKSRTGLKPRLATLTPLRQSFGSWSTAVVALAVVVELAVAAAIVIAAFLGSTPATEGDSITTTGIGVKILSCCCASNVQNIARLALA